MISLLSSSFLFFFFERSSIFFLSASSSSFQKRLLSVYYFAFGHFDRTSLFLCVGLSPAKPGEGCQTRHLIRHHLCATGTLSAYKNPRGSEDFCSGLIISDTILPYLSPKWHFLHITCRSCHQTCCNKWNEGHSCVQRHAMNRTGCASVWPRYWEDELPDMLVALPFTAIKAAHCTCSWATPRPSLGNWLLCILVSLGSEEEQACFDVLHK